MIPVTCFLAVLVTGIVGYRLLGHPLGDALSLTWSDLTPTESGIAADPAARWLSLAIGGLGVVSAFVALAAVVTIALEGGFGFSSRRRRMQQRVEDLEDHYIVCAYGRVGRAAARELETEGVPFVVIESREDVEPRMRADRVLYISGDPTSEPVLKRAGIERARGLVCAVDSDATNVYITLTARSLNPDIYIVARASEAETPERLRRAGANRVISPYRSSGQRMAHLVLRPRVVDSLELLGKRLEEVVVESGSTLIGLSLQEACAGAVPLVIYRSDGETKMHPPLEEVVRAGDRILVWGEGAPL
jgi:voltage-gated potassium channel